MLEISTTDFTGLAMEAKNTLDKFFRIPLKEEAIDIVEKMKERNTKLYADSLSDLDDRLVKILSNDQTYLSKNFVWRPDGKKAVKSLFEKSYEDAKAEEDKKPYEERKVVSIYRDIERNFTTIKEYETYVNNLKSVKELDKLFLRNLNAIYTEYRSSTDYMSRLVRRLLKYNFKYSDENIKDVETRVLILRRLINAYGYDCVNEISTPELENIVMKDFGGDVEKITDDIFRYLEEDRERGVYDKKYVTALVELQATIIYKSSTIPMTEELCKELCTLICKEATLFEKKTKTIKKYEKKILTDSAINGTAKLLKECFYEPSTFSIQFIKDYKNADINKILAFKQKLDSQYKKGKKAMRESFSDIDESIRLGILFKNFSDRINVSERIIALFAIAFSKKITLQEGKVLKDCFTEENLKTIKSIKQRNIIKDSEKYTAIKELLEECEKCLNTQEKEQYLDLIYKKIGDRFNGAKNPSKKDNLYKSANEIFGINIADYKMLKIADDLANARFSPHGKTREYLYIFAIAFEMTSTGYTEDATIIDEKTGAEIIDEDPRKITDIQKNLFFDYYADNIINSMSKISGLSGQSSDETIIDGYGINYKNFAEIVFLWSINQKGLPAEKLKLAYEVINYCKKNGHAKGLVEVEAEKKKERALTRNYEDLLFNFTALNKEDLEAFLINNYSCRTNKASTDINNRPETAKAVCTNYINNRILKYYKKITSHLFNENILETQKMSLLFDLLMLDDQGMFDFYKREYYLKKNRCGNCSENKDPSSLMCSAFSEKCEQWYCDYICSLDINEKNQFESHVIKYLEKKLENPKNEFNESFYHLSNQCTNEQNGIKCVLQNTEKRIKSTLDVIEKEKDFKASRAAVLSLCYIEYILLNWHERVYGKYRFTHDFSEFYKSFCGGRTFLYKKKNKKKNLIETVEVQFEGADFYLKEAGYQPVNTKNLFDISIIFMAYRDNYKQLFQYAGDELVSSYRTVTEYREKHKKEIEKDKIYEDDISKDR